MKYCAPLFFVLTGLLSLSTVRSVAAVKMPQIFSDHMVLQRDMPVRVWGWASAGEHVRVAFNGQQRETVADSDGGWQVTLKEMPASDIPQSLTVQGENTLIFRDVLVGEVWVCSGQSNMERLLEQTIYSEADLASAEDNLLRYFHVLPATAVTPQDDVERWDPEGWTVSTAERALQFSSVCFFAGRELRRHLKVPIALIDSTKGGTRAQIWTSLDAIQAHVADDPEFPEWLQQRDLLMKQLAQRNAEYPGKKAQYDEALAEWTRQINTDPAYTAAMKRWQGELDQAQKDGTEWPVEPKPPLPKPIEPALPDDGPYSTFMIGNLYNAMIAPLTKLAIRGVFWYQGETNDKNAPQYKVLFPLLIRDWRDHWHEGDFPFLFVQLPNIHRPQIRPVQDEDPWPWMREAQLDALVLPNTAMAVTIDIGDPWNVHGKDKRDIGIRLSLLARNRVYGEKIVAQGPTIRSMRIRGDRAVLRFDHIDTGLKIGVPPWTPTGVAPQPATELRGFAIASADRQWYWATARIDGNKVVLWSPEVSHPVAVRYGWADNPPCNLYSRQNLPTAPFRTDDWERTEGASSRVHR